MLAEMPWSLLAAWTVFFGCVNTHQRHASHFGGRSPGYAFALYISVLVGSAAGLGLLVFYFVKVSWYWPFLLFAFGSVLGGILFGILDGFVGPLAMNILAWIGWPAAAIWAFFIIRALHP
jgi:hypothetical protein